MEHALRLSSSFSAFSASGGEVSFVACSSSETVLDAMKKMVGFGVGSVAVLQDEVGATGLGLAGPASGPGGTGGGDEKLLLSSISNVEIARVCDIFNLHFCCYFSGFLCFTTLNDFTRLF